MDQIRDLRQGAQPPRNVHNTALKWLQRALRVAPRDVEVRLLLSRAHWLDDDVDEAVEILLDYIKQPSGRKRISRAFS